MTRYFFHLRDGTDEILDPEGVEMPLEAVAAAAMTGARDCLAADARAGRVDLRYRIDVEQGAGELVCSLAFADALEIVGGD
jgi:hypothetical protein